MKVSEGIDSLKLECALHDLGFIDYYHLVVAHAGGYFIRPVGWRPYFTVNDELFGFQIAKPEIMIPDFLEHKGYLPFASSAKLAIRQALSGEV